MPAGPSESLLITLFADIHYYFSSPTSTPHHHRLSKGSYLYLFNHAASQQVKLEIANHAGTPDQDAFSGYLNSTRITYSYKQPTLFTILVDGGSVQGHDQWHIPSYDERNEQKYLYKIHTVDAYLWTEKDATTLLGHLKNILPADRLDIKDAPTGLQSPAEHRDSMSPVVQQLEKTAIGSHFPPRAESTASAQSLPGPPTPASAAATSPPLAQQAAPMAYNPAAPAAPETVVYREKTPPPIDDGTGTGLANAAKYDSMPQQQYASIPPNYQTSQQSTPQQSYFPGPPQQQFPGPPQPPMQRTHSGSLPPPPPPPPGGPSPLQHQQIYNPSFASPPTSPPANQPHFNRQSSISSGPPGQTQFASYNPQTQSQPQHTPSFGPGAVASPGLPGTPGQQPPTPSYNPQQQQQQMYSQYQYQPQQPSGPGGYQGELHGQTYQPTAAEVQANPKLAVLQQQQWQQQQQAQAGAGPAQGGQQQPSMGGRVDAYEKKVGGFLKRLDRKFGI